MIKTKIAFIFLGLIVSVVVFTLAYNYRNKLFENERLISTVRKLELEAEELKEQNGGREEVLGEEDRKLTEKVVENTVVEPQSQSDQDKPAVDYNEKPSEAEAFEEEEEEESNTENVSQIIPFYYVDDSYDHKAELRAKEAERKAREAEEEARQATQCQGETDGYLRCMDNYNREMETYQDCMSRQDEKMQDYQGELEDYNDCITRYNKDLEDYQDCVEDGDYFCHEPMEMCFFKPHKPFPEYCIKPVNFCRKPICY